mmetsp:Transcript_17137/g.23984  ORF Transcript_17137/g.23984 Transcript_17137/m.23984 type:complete len:144 (-) Transcript_17137:535-966(-)
MHLHYITLSYTYTKNTILHEQNGAFMNGLEYDVHSNILLYRCYFFKKIMSSSMSLHVVFPFSLFLSEIIVYIYTDFDFCDFRDFLPNRFLIPLIIFLFFFLVPGFFPFLLIPKFEEFCSCLISSSFSILEGFWLSIFLISSTA